MKLIYKGTYSGNPEDLPQRPHEPNAIPFKEFDSPKELARYANMAAISVLIITLILYLVRVIPYIDSPSALFKQFWGILLTFLTLFPHEFLHAICFKEEVYLYTNLKQGMLFVVGPESMSKKRFVGMSLLPNVIFGFLPYIIFLCYPQYGALGLFGAFSLSMGVGDYYNVYNAITQMPKGARTYLHGFNSFWYIP